ncbi:MAG: FecR family protein [Bacteroidales bacterium]
MKDPIYLLFEKYANGTITADEWKQLCDIIPTLPDAAIKSILEDVWVKYEYTGKKRAQSFRKIDRIIKEKKKGKVVHLFRQLRNIAAIGLVILAGYQAYSIIQGESQNNSASKDLQVIVAEGERATVKLPDGSTVKLNAGTELSYPADFGESKRKLRLVGEGYFEVNKDKKKPFIVETSDLYIKVLGTTFNVSAYSNSPVIETSLVEGSVALYSDNESFPESQLKPNQKAIFNIKERKLVIENTDSKEDIAWLSGKFIFKSAPLRDVLEELCKYYGYQLQCSESGYLSDRFSGSFEGESLDEILQALQYHYDFKFRIHNKNLIIQFNH